MALSEASKTEEECDVCGFLQGITIARIWPRVVMHDGRFYTMCFHCFKTFKEDAQNGANPRSKQCDMGPTAKS